MTPTREEFFSLTGFEKGLFYVLAFASLGYAASTIWQRSRIWKQGKPIGWPSGPSVWLKNVVDYVLLQRKVRSSRKRSGAPMHLLIFYGFLSLFLATTLLGINTYSPWKFHKGAYYLAYELAFDLLGLLLVVGLVWALVRRAISSGTDVSSVKGTMDETSMPHSQTMGETPMPQGQIMDGTTMPQGQNVDGTSMPQSGTTDGKSMPSSPNMDGTSMRQSGTLDETSKPRGRGIPIARGAEDTWALWLLLIIAVTGYWLEGARMSANPQAWDIWSPVGHSLSLVTGKISPDLYRAVWWFHMAWVFVFFATFPRMRLRHIAMAIFSSAGRPEHPMGRLEPITMEQVEKTGQIGVASYRDFTRWHLMSLDACMECGRCTEVCPAWNAGKVLNPKKIVQDIRASFVPESQPNGTVWTDTPMLYPDPPTVADAVSEEALWACTTCNACVEACPVSIRHVDLIVDARRNLVAEGKLAGTPAVMLRQTASTGHAWGAPRNEREKWMEGLDVPLCRNGVEFEYLFWVGCAGATDPGAVKTTKAIAQLLTKAGVSFACLGQEEACTGDPARRTGDEFLFQEKAMENLSTFERYGVKKVVTACPHCFNTLLNEYGEIEGVLADGGDPKPMMEVLHHTQLLAQLVAEGKLAPASGSGTVIHDPCYLGRVNGEADALRSLLGEATNYNAQSPDGLGLLIRPKQLVEPQFYARKTRCCGAGGGRMWMEEEPDQRPGNRRAEELLSTGAKTVALACPFCRIMLDASVKQVTDDEIRLVDLAELLQDANA